MSAATGDQPQHPHHLQQSSLSDMQRFLQYHDQQSSLLGIQRFNPSSVLSSGTWNETMVTMFSPPHQSYDLMGSRKAFCFSQDDDPMLGYPRVAPAATAATTVVENSHDEKQHATWTTVTPTKMHANTGMESPSASIASSHTMWSSPGPEDEQYNTTQQPTTPGDSYQDSVYPSPFSPPSTGIIPVTSTILDMDADQELFSLPANISSTTDCDNNLAMLFAHDSTTSPADSTQLSASSLTINGGDDTLMADSNTDCCFSEDEDEDAYDDVFAPWPATLPHTPTAAEDELLVDEQQQADDDDMNTAEFADNSSIDEEEYEEEEEEDGEIYESHPLNQLLLDLQGQVAKHTKMNESQWTGINERAIDVLTHDDGEFPPIRQCIYDCLHTLASRVIDRPIANPRRCRRQSASSAQQHNKPRRQRQASAPVSTSVLQKEYSTEPPIQAPKGDLDVASSTTIDTTLAYDNTSLEDDEGSASIPTTTTTLGKRSDEWIPEDDDDDDDDLSCRDTSSEYGEGHAPQSRRRRRRTSSSSSFSSSSSSSSSQHGIPKKTRKNYSRETTNVLMNWYLQHGGKTPEPNHKAMLAEQANKTLVQGK